MKHHHLRPLLFTVAVVALAGCGRDALDVNAEVDAPSRARRFLAAEHLDTVRAFDWLATGSNWLAFGITFGEPTSCGATCVYPRAYAMGVGDRIGWLKRPAEGSGPLLDILPGDTSIFQPLVWQELGQIDGAAGDALRLRLASDADTPVPVLVDVAGAAWNEEIASALLAHPKGGTDTGVLLALVLAPVYLTGDPNLDVAYVTAWSRLADRVAGPADLSLAGEAGVVGGRVQTRVVARNAASVSMLARVICPTPVLRLYRDSTYMGRPAWDEPGLAFPGACRSGIWPGSVKLIAGGSSAAFDDRDFVPAAILGDSLAAGRYWAALDIQIATPVGNTSAVVRAGPLDLAR